MFDVVTVGETMMAFVGHDDPRRYDAVAAGAESNVATTVARLRHRARWVSRLGDDPLGRRVAAAVGESGVETDVVWDAARPTGIMTIHLPARVATYHRRGSAASALSLDDLDRLSGGRWLHVTGITPALSSTARELVEAIVVDRAVDARISFDVNLRPVLWPDRRTAATVLLRLARHADVAFIGDDEARTLFDTDAVERLAALVPRRDDQELVLKRGPGPATTIRGDGATTVPARPAEVVDPTGAGDAFAGGYLVASLRGWPPEARLRLGHLMAARTLAVVDHVPPPDPSLADLTVAALAGG